jgi:hypothetical protein
MLPPLADVCCARLPADGLAVLADLRTRPGVRVVERDGVVWVFWPPADADVTTRLLPVQGVELFTRRDGLWFRVGQHLPYEGVPDEEGRPLAEALTPAALALPAPPEPSPRPVRLTVVRDGQPRPATALLAPLADLARWADLATSHALSALEAAVCGDVVLVRGAPLPPLAGGTRLWGRLVLVPLGWRPEPDLPEAALADALGLREGRLALLNQEGVEVLPAAALAPLTRAGLRLALQGLP